MSTLDHSPERPWSPALALHTWTLDTTPMAQVLAIARETGWDGVELRQVDFDRAAAAGETLDDTIAAIRTARVPVVTLGTRSGFLFAQGDERRALLASLEASCRTAQALGCPVLMTGPGQREASMREAAAVLREAGDIVAGHGLRLAVEFSWMHPVLSSVPRLAELLDAAAHPACGALLDTYHLQRSGRPGRGFGEVDGSRIFAVQFSDCATEPSPDPRPPADRLMPGEGDVAWAEVLGALADAGYAGPLSCEAPNPALWALDAHTLAAQALASIRAQLARVG
ncbi:MAG: sugar phosphate isomerase/epimerase [Ideonella sp.]|jgi:sugar phosphate isomerase/epimerase|nr:sugar phosphate isomerase/epimerase [Ideonella sp.]